MARTVMLWKSATASRLYTFDAVEIEAPSHEMAITEYPIEVGANLIDHVRPRPVELRLTAVVTNAPARDPDLPARPEYPFAMSHLDGMSPARELTVYAREPLIDVPPAYQLPTSIAGNRLSRIVPHKGVVRTWGMDGTPAPQRVQKIYAELVDAQKSAREFTVVIDLLGEYDHMLIRSLRTQRDGKSGTGLRLEMELRQVTYAELYRSDVTALLPTHQRSKPPVDKGKPPEATPDAKTEEASETLLHHLTGGLFERSTAPVP